MKKRETGKCFVLAFSRDLLGNVRTQKAIQSSATKMNSLKNRILAGEEKGEFRQDVFSFSEDKKE